MNIQPMAFRRQKGAALLVSLAILLLGGPAALLAHFNGEASAGVNRGKANGSALADAKAALIAWSATYPPSAARESAPGTLPFIYAAISQDAVAGGNADLDADCTTPANTCLALNAAGAASRTDIRALLLSSGVEWTNQDRAIGDCDGDGGGPSADPTDDSFLCAYFDGDTTIYNVSTDLLRHGLNTQTITADFFSRDTFGAGFNDQIRVIEPLPP
jgi:hypothetical protein